MYRHIKAALAGLLVCLLCAACGETAVEKPAETSGGLRIDHSMELQYAENFSVDYCTDGAALLTIVDGGRYLVVPEGQQPPADLERDITVLQQPLDHIYLVATAAMDLFAALDGLDAITLSGTRAEDWYVEEARAAMEAGTIAYAGKYNAPDYERIVADGCDLAIESTMVYHTPEVQEKLTQFGIPVLVDRSSYESHPLGRMEWIRLYAVLLGKEAVADSRMAEQTAQLKAVTDGVVSGKSAAFFYITGNGAANVRKSGDYVAKLLSLAGGRYVFEDLGGEENALSTVNLQMEEFYATAKDADVLIYNSTIGGELHSLDELLEKSPLLKTCKAVQTGDVWCTTANMFQKTMCLGDMLVDFHTVLTDSHPPDRLGYLYRLE
ncbi:MAG: ABC transporter substrate-binding protein [Oscillospiraceae bacterium]